jgi:hypothetical protein
MYLRLITTTCVAAALGCVATPIALADPPGSPPLQAAHYDGRSPDTKDAAHNAHLKRSTNVVKGASAASFDGRSPDTKDAAAAAQTRSSAPVVIVSASGFDWTDGGIGAAAGFGLALALAAGLGLLGGTQRLAQP